MPDGKSTTAPTLPGWAQIAFGVAPAYLLSASVVLPQLGSGKAHLDPDLLDGARITHTAQSLPGDPLNLALLGSIEDLRRAMLAAGWRPADALGLQGDVRIAVDTVLGKTHPNALVSNLYLFGRKEDLAFEKPVGHSPKERHHVRFGKWFPPLHQPSSLSVVSHESSTTI